jgi:hypothetical protein
MTAHHRSIGFSLLLFGCIFSAGCGSSTYPALNGRPSDAAQGADASPDAAMVCEATRGVPAPACLVPRGGDDCLDAYVRFAPPNGRLFALCSSPGVCANGDRCELAPDRTVRCTCGNDGTCARGLLCIAETVDATPRCVCPMSR